MKVGETTGQMHEAMIEDIAMAYKMIEHAYDVIGTGFDELSWADLSGISFNLGCASEQFREMANALCLIDVFPRGDEE